MFQRLKIYTVHLKPDAQDTIERLRFVPEGFSFYAFIFTLFWALYHRMWRFAALIALLNIGLSLLLWQADALETPTLDLCQIGLQLWIGFAAHDYLRAHLRRQGFILYALVSGENELRAEQRFFDQNAPQLTA